MFTVDPPIVFQNALILTQNADRRTFRGDVRVEDGRITAVAEKVPTEGAEIVPCEGKALVPGFINTHGHVAMSILRGVADDVDLSGFLNILFAVDAGRTDTDLEAGAALGIAEMLLSGTTSFLDLYYGQDAIARAVERLGIRSYLGWAVLDPELTTQKGLPIENARAFIQRWKGHARVTPLVAPQGVYVCGKETWLAARDLAKASGTFCHYHLSETRREVHEHESKTGLRPPLWLDSIGFFEGRSVAAHAVWLTRRENPAAGRPPRGHRALRELEPQAGHRRSGPRGRAPAGRRRSCRSGPTPPPRTIRSRCCGRCTSPGSCKSIIAGTRRP